MTATVALSDLRSGLSPRSTKFDFDHVNRLMGVWDLLPPILVHGDSMRIVDGEHRKAAAGLLGLVEVEVEWFDGDEIAARDEATRRNNAHGLPLTQADRKRDAARMVTDHPDWSDRQIAEACGISHPTVAGLRSTGKADQLNRQGADGKSRPVDPAARREHAHKIICEQPEASLRDVAAEAGLSPATVRDVKQRVGRGEDPVPPRLRPVPEPEPQTEPRVSDYVTAIPDWRKGSEFKVSSAASEFGTWMHTRTRWVSYADWTTPNFEACPPQHRELAAKQLRRVAAYYEAAAQELENPAGLRSVQ